MFILSRLKSLVRLEPKEFNRPLPEALADVLNAKLANKIVQGRLLWLKPADEITFKQCWRQQRCSPEFHWLFELQSRSNPKF